MAAIRLLLFTGCRKGDVDEVGSGPDTKNGPSRTVHLNAKAQEVLVELQGEGSRRRGPRRASLSSRLGTRKGHIYGLRKPFENDLPARGCGGLPHPRPTAHVR